MDSEIKNVCAIQDEDVLRRMWQQTEDFGKKKEIRSHMYKLREARLKEFYTSGEVLKDVQRSNSSPGLREQVEKNTKWVEGVTHADSLADHSFLSLKSKEIRDSESPTREVQYKNTRNRADTDGAWTIHSNTTKSQDGKTLTSSQIATTKGSRPIDGGNLSYSGLDEQKSMVYSDGDANNFTKAVGESSKVVAEQEKVVGDENNFMKCHTKSSSSSSQMVSVQHQNLSNMETIPASKMMLQIEDGGDNRNIQQDNDQQQHSTVNKQHSSNVSQHQEHHVEQTSQTQSSKVTKESKTSTIQQTQDKIHSDVSDGGCATVVTTRTITSSDLPEDLKKSIADGNTKVFTETKTLPDGTKVTTTRYETKGSKQWNTTSGSSQSQVTTSKNQKVVEQKSSSDYSTRTKSSTDKIDSGKDKKIITTTATKQIDYPEPNIGTHNKKTVITTATKQIDYPEGEVVLQINLNNVQNENQSQLQDLKKDKNSVHKENITISRSTVKDTQDTREFKDTKISKVVQDGKKDVKIIKTYNDDVVESQIEPIAKKSQPPQAPQTPQKSSPAPRPQDIELTKSCKPVPETYKPSTPTDGQYSTTYRSEFTNKRISVDISPTHDAFVRSLRSKSPENIHSDRPKSRGQTGSTSSLRSSPEKNKSPERKPDRRSPEKTAYSRRHTTSPNRPSGQPSPNRPSGQPSPGGRYSTSPERNYPKSNSTTTSYTETRHNIATDTSTRKKSTTPSRKSPERPTTIKCTTRGISPEKKIDVIITKTSKTSTVTPKGSGPQSPTKVTEKTVTSTTKQTSNTSDKQTINSDTITRKKKTSTQEKPEDGNKMSRPFNLATSPTKDKVDETVNTDTITRKKNKTVTSQTIDSNNSTKHLVSLDVSPTTSVSEFEFINHTTTTQMVTDLDEPEAPKEPERRPSSLEITLVSTVPKSGKKSPTKARSPTKEQSSPVKPVPKFNDNKFKPSAPLDLTSPSEQPPSVFSIDDKHVSSTVVPVSENKPSKQFGKEKPPLKRTETYEERCRQILGLSEPDETVTKTDIPDDYAGREPIEEPLFVKKHIDYSTPDDDHMHKVVERIKKKKNEKESLTKEQTKSTTNDFISIEKEIKLPERVETVKPLKKDEPKMYSKKPVTPQQPKDIPDYAGREPIEEPLFVKKHIDYSTPDDDHMHKVVERTKKKKNEKESLTKEQTKSTTNDFISIEKEIKLPESVETVNPLKKDEPKMYSKKPVAPKQLKDDKNPIEGEYTTEYTDEFIEQEIIKSSPKKPEEEMPGYMKPIPKVSTEERDRVILETRQREITSPTKDTTKQSTEYDDEYTEKTSRYSPDRTGLKPQEDKVSDNRRFSTEYTDEFNEKELKGNVCNVIRTDKTISTNYKQMETPVRAPSPKKLKDTKSKPKSDKDHQKKKPIDQEESTTSDEEESVDIDEYYRTQIKTEEKIKRKSPSPVRRRPQELLRERDQKSPPRGLPENKTVVEYINDFCDQTQSTKNIVDRNITTSDFITKEKLNTNITLTKTDKNPVPQPRKPLSEVEFNLDEENQQKSQIRTHRIDNTVTTAREISPKRLPQRAVAAETMECCFHKTTSSKVIENGHTSPDKKEDKPVKTLQKRPLEDRSKSPAKQVKDVPKTSPKSLTIKKTSKEVIDINNKRRVSEEIIKKKPLEDKPLREKSPEKKEPCLRSSSPIHKTVNKKNIETVIEVTRKCTKKDAPTVKPKPSDSPARKPLYAPPAVKSLNKPSKENLFNANNEPVQPVKNKHVVTKTICLTSQSNGTSKQQSIKESPKPSIPKTITSVKSTKITQPATITVTKVTKSNSKKLLKQKSKDFVPSDSESDIEELTERRTTSRIDNKKKIVTNSMKVTSTPGKPKLPQVSMPTFKRSTSSREPTPDKIFPIPVLSDDEESYPRYPDQVSEPDDAPRRNRPFKINDIPLTEEEHVDNFSRIIEVTETTTQKASPRITNIDRVTEEDESLLSVTEKVSKFITTAEKLSVDEPNSKTPAPRVVRPDLHITEDLENDECLLSVSDKVTKFISTAEQVSTKKSDRPRSPTKTEKREFKVEENDECLKSVNEKVSHFIQAADVKPKKVATGPAPKVSRPEFTDLDETLEKDECLLSVSDKVSKFLTTTDKLSTSETNKIKTDLFIKREKSPEKLPQEVRKSREPSPQKTKPDAPSLLHTPSRKSPEKISPSYSPSSCSRKSLEKPKPDSSNLLQSPSRKSPEKTSPEASVQRPKSESIDTKPLKSSEAVRKAKEMFENISKTQEVPKQRDILSRPSIWEGRKKEIKIEDNEEVKLTDIGVYKKKESSPVNEVRRQLNYNKNDINENKRRLSTDYKDVTLKSTKLILNENKYNSKLARVPSPERDTCYSKTPEIILEKSIRHYDDEEDVIPGYMKPIPKVSTEERDQLIIETRLRESVTPEKESYKRTTYITDENGLEPGYMRPLQKSLSLELEVDRVVTKREEIVIKTKSYCPSEKQVPGYMKPLNRKTSPERDCTTSGRDGHDNIDDDNDDAPRAGKKFGVTLRRTDSGRMVQVSPERRKSSTPGQPVIEDIQDLEVLERMMDKVVGYEQRRRIRAQIRIVKKLLSDNKIVKKTKALNVHKISSEIKEPERKTLPNKKISDISKPKEIRQSESSYQSSFNSSTTTRERSLSPENKKRLPLETKICSKRTETTSRRSVSPEVKSNYNENYKTSFMSTSSSRITTEQKLETRSTSSRERSSSPEMKRVISSPSSSTKVYKTTDLRRVNPTVKPTPSQEEKPSWVMNRNLKKTRNEATEQQKRTLIIQNKKKDTTRTSSPKKDLKPTDCITSSYGIGPMDENGLPLFGIKALRKATADNVEVSGTVVSSQFYSENGGEPVGEISVTKYSTDPKELNIKNTKKGFAAVTTTQKFGTKDSPTFSTLVNKKKSITAKNSEDELIKTTSNKTNRRGSVKALSQKFIENAAEISSKEKQSYPKAGLILRTSSFKDSTETSTEKITRREMSSSRESSPGLHGEKKVSLESITSASNSQNFSSIEEKTTKTFLNNHSRATDAQDVISRMKNAEKEHLESDTAEDREARMLLNKFLGTQVLMSGMEPLLGTGSSAQSTVSSSAQLVRKVQKKTSSSTVAGNTTSSSNQQETGKSILSKRFQCPITPELLQDIWDEQTLRELLEQCTDYEERRAIRARLRQVMAEQEAVANVLSSAVAERDVDNRNSIQERVVESSKRTFTQGPITTTQEVSTRVITKQTNKPMSPFAKFRQLDKQNSLNTPPSSPRTPTGAGPLFKFTDPALSLSAATVKERLLHWCQMKTREYENIKLENFSTSWADGLAFCALIHHFLPDAFDYHALSPQHRRHNFTLAFKVADEQADIFPLLDVDDMVAMRRPDWKCVFTYVQAIYRRFKDED